MRLLVAAIVMSLGTTAVAGTLEQIKAADCRSSAGSYLRLNTETQVLEAKFSSLPALTNLHEGERMPVEIQREDGYTSVLGLVVNMHAGVFGSVGLYTKTGEVLTPRASVKAVFRDMEGKVETETLLCDFVGI